LKTSCTSVIAIDPGHVKSAYVCLDDRGRIADHRIEDNNTLASRLRQGQTHSEPLELPDAAAIEMVACYGMAVGREIFETCVWIGRFTEILELSGSSVTPVYRRDVKLSLCGQSRAKDPNIRQALIDLYGDSKEQAIGRKATPGPLYGIKSHEWAALGVGVTWMRSVTGEVWQPSADALEEPEVAR